MVQYWDLGIGASDRGAEQTGRGDPTIGELWPQQPSRKGSCRGCIAAATGAQAHRMQVVSPNDTVRNDILTPTLTSTRLFRPPIPPPAVQPTVAARACRRHWTRFASVGLIVGTSIGCMLCPVPSSEAHNYETGTCLSMSPSLAADPSSSLFAPSQRVFEIAIFTGNSPPPTGQRSRTQRPQRQYSVPG